MLWQWCIEHHRREKSIQLSVVANAQHSEKSRLRRSVRVVHGAERGWVDDDEVGSRLLVHEEAG